MVWEPGVMWREKRMFAITVQGDVREGLQGATLTHALLPGLREIEARWHAAGDTAYRIDVAGAVEESSKGSDAIVAGVPVMLFLTFTLRSEEHTSELQSQSNLVCRLLLEK